MSRGDLVKVFLDFNIIFVLKKTNVSAMIIKKILPKYKSTVRHLCI